MAAPSSPTPTPTAPADGERVEAPPFVFRWEPPDKETATGGVAAYELQVASDASFKDVLFHEDVGTGTEANLSSLPHRPGVELHWRVRGRENSGAWGAFSEAARFRVAGEAGEATSAAAGAATDPTSKDVTTRRREWSIFTGVIVVSLLAVVIPGYYFTAGVDYGGVDPANAPAADTTAEVAAREDAEAARRLSTYGPAEGDEGAGAYRIPIEQAMALVAGDSAAASFSDLATDSAVVAPAEAALPQE